MSQFKGTYVFKQNGIEIGRSDNLITTNGRKSILQYMAGVKQDWASDIAIGAINTTPSASDIQLNFETARVPVIMKTFQTAYGNSPDLIIVRGMLPSNMYANIYEIGIYPTKRISATSVKSNRLIEDFTSLDNWDATSGSATYTPFSPQAPQSPRIGNYSVQLDVNTVYENNSLSIDMSNYSSTDQLQILAYNTVAGSLDVVFTDIYGYTSTVSYTLTTNTGYEILSNYFSSTTNGAEVPIQNLNTVKSISISTSTGGVITIDALKVSVAAELTNQEYLVSKSVLTTPIAKIYNTPLDIEYYIQLS